uniref:Mid2 domain-containing protein n=1 Tax=Panagrellus redivivus TaxID=6233 RepID=A0A7E4W380_PANRE
MQLCSNVLVFAALVCFGRAEIVLKQGKNQTVAFEGNELIIQLENPQMQRGSFKMCFGSTPDVAYEICPQGFGGVWINTLDKTKTYKLNRQGQLLRNGVDLTISDKVIFNVDGTINVLVVGMPNGGSVKLPNAEVPVATTTALASEKKQTNGKAMIKIVGVIGILILLVVIIGAVLLYLCWYRKRNHRPMRVPTVYQARDENAEPNESLVAKASVTSQIRPVSTTTTTPKLTSTSTTRASEDKPQLVVSSKPAPIACVASPAGCVSLVPASTQTSTPGTVLRQKSTKTKVSKKSRRHLSTTSKTMQSDKATEPSSLSPEYNDDRSSKRRSNDPFSGSTYSRH